MKIAAITITYNDGYKFNEWFQNYLEYKDDLFLHIIVDNNSKEEYLSKVEEKFTESVIIKRKSNGGCTLAYNEGIRYALNNSEVDAIMLIGNDMKLEEKATPQLFRFLYSNENYGMVEPIILSKDSNIIEDFGCEISKYLYMKPYDVGKNISDVGINKREVASVTGGMNMAKKEFYERVGLQDEKLFMYSDEVDMAIRAKKAGYKMAVTKEVRAWHQHINPVNLKTRPSYTGYLIGRNKVYLSNKHFGFLMSILEFIYLSYIFFRSIINSFSKSNIEYQLYFLLGAVNGLFGNMNSNKFSKPKETN